MVYFDLSWNWMERYYTTHTCTTNNKPYFDRVTHYWLKIILLYIYSITATVHVYNLTTVHVQYSTVHVYLNIVYHLSSLRISSPRLSSARLSSIISTSIIYRLRVYHLSSARLSSIVCASIIYRLRVYHLSSARLSYIVCASIIYRLHVYHIPPPRGKHFLNRFLQISGLLILHVL